MKFQGKNVSIKPTGRITQGKQLDHGEWESVQRVQMGLYDNATGDKIGVVHGNKVLVNNKCIGTISNTEMANK